MPSFRKNLRELFSETDFKVKRTNFLINQLQRGTGDQKIKTRDQPCLSKRRRAQSTFLLTFSHLHPQ